MQDNIIFFPMRTFFLGIFNLDKSRIDGRSPSSVGSNGTTELEFDVETPDFWIYNEPIMNVFMGSMIGGLMIAMYSPIFNVGAIIGG